MVRGMLLGGCTFLLSAGPAFAGTIASLSAPAAIETRALNVHNNSLRGASALALTKGFEAIGVKTGDVVIFSGLMDSRSLFLVVNVEYCFMIIRYEVLR